MKPPIANETPAKAGRPSLYSQEITDEICRRLHESDGDDLPESLRQICRDDKMPSLSAVSRWLTEDDKAGFREQYAHARSLRMDALVDRYLSLGKDAITHASGECASAKIQAIKLEMDAIKWILSKEYGHNYGDKITQELTGKDGGAIKTAAMSPDTEKELADCMRAVRDSLIIPEGLVPLNK